ncbi:MAG: hypothetical protein JNN03_06560 [Rubrivivax sp.]|nr:hypothetical protein [Rubrivivax sp.]
MGLRADQSQRLVALFVFGALLLTFPLLALFNVNTSVGGIPLLYAYLFGAWGLLIGLLRWAARLPPEPGLAHDVSHERGSEAATGGESRRGTPPEAGRQPR